MKKLLLSIFFTIILLGCQKSVSNLENTLELAGGNRSEIEKVLDHYSQKPEDSLKYRAAYFLIENMPGHLSYVDTAFYNKFYHEVDSLADTYKGLRIEEKESKYIGIMNKYQERHAESIEDIKIITAEYLINNIDKAYRVWTESN